MGCPDSELAMNHADATRIFYAHLWPQRAVVLRTARFLCHNHAEADDLAQETLVKAFKSIQQFDESRPAGAKSWLSAILRNTWIDRMRASGRHGTALSIEAEEFDVADSRGTAAVADVEDPAAMLEAFSDAEMIAALKTLPEEIRWTLLLVDVESLDHGTAAEILGVPEGTVKSRAHRGRAMLRAHLTKDSTSSVEDLP
jgi:RNA polymerase sigma-70 factor (ECF subfamily)